jgi:hypothetical protein
MGASWAVRDMTCTTYNYVGVPIMKSSVSLGVWRALSTRNGGEVTSSSDC